MKWIYPYMYYQIYKFLSRIRIKSDWRVIAFNALLFLSFCITIILDQILRTVRDNSGFNYTMAHMLVVLGIIMILHVLMVFNTPGIRKIEEESISLSPVNKRISNILVVGIIVTAIVLIIKLFLK